MATRLFTRSLITTTKQSLLRLRHLVAAANNLPQALLSGTGGGVRGFSTRRTSSSLKDPNPNWSNRPPKETILLDGCDFEHWLVVMENPEGDPTREDIIDSYIKTLAKVVGSEEEARMKIYSVSTRHYYAFGALVSEELSYKLKELDKVRWVLPDSYLHVREKDYGGEPFINGQAVPYDPKYHEEWLRNNNRPPRKDRPYNIGRRRDVQTNRGPWNMGETPPPPQNNNMPAPPNIHGTLQPLNNNMSGPPNMHGYGMPKNNRSAGPPNAYGVPQNMYGPPNNGNNPPNYMSGPSNMPPNNNFSRPPNMSGPPPNMSGGMQGNNMSQPQSNYNRGVVPPGNAGGPGYAPTFQHGNIPMNNGVPFQGQQQSNYAPNPHADYPYQNQNLPGRDMPSN